MNLNNFLKIAIEASIHAGQEIMDVYDSDDFQIESKKDKSPLTKADRNADLKILEFLKETNIPVLSEEGKHLPYEERKKWDYFWLVDPLDGTKEFIKRNGEFTVNIALIKGQNPIMGIIYVPVTKALYFGDNETGAFKIEDIDLAGFKKENFSILSFDAVKLPLPSVDKPYTVVSSRSHLSDETVEYIKELKKEHGEIEMMPVGSSLKQCMIAEGKADIYPRFGPTMEWDTAASHAILNASGATLTQIDGSPLAYNKENLLNPYFIVKR
ncbi:MAG: 3'(2'),5'-bisphosphate nucleotidase CysQ [Bacteroidales bacterium]|nr:3'(2'),5'-bisphosphate nucleotidase CysQ [Bacteroidales bacterium]